MSSGTAYRPRRSVLYLPGNNERALEKARTLPADGLILDLEDAVAPDHKEVARDNACAAARSGDYGQREVTIRVNASGTPWHEDDVAAACAAGPAAIVVPKVGSADDVRDLVAAMEHHGAPEHTRLWAMIETPAAVLDVRAIAAASGRLAVLVMGVNDLVKELGARPVAGREPLLATLSVSLLAARAAGIGILDGVWNDVRDLDGLEDECRQGRDLGFDGKTLIHPAQIEPCNRVFAPSPEEVEEARAIVGAWEAGSGVGVVTHGGRMVERLHVDSALRVIATDEAIRSRR